MQTLWSRAAQTQYICKCAFCRSTTALNPTTTSSALKRRLRFRDVFTVFYSTVLASAAVADSHRKDVRRKEWEVAIKEAKEELAALEDQQRGRLVSLSQRFSEDENTIPVPILRAPRRNGKILSESRRTGNMWEDVFASAARDTRERELLGFQDLLGSPLSVLRDLTKDDIERLLNDPAMVRLNNSRDSGPKIWAARRRNHPWSVKKGKTLEWSVRKLAYRLLLSCEEERLQEQPEEGNKEAHEVRLDKTMQKAISGRIDRCQRSLNFIANNPGEPALWLMLRSPSIPSYQCEATVDTRPMIGELLGLFRSYEDGTFAVDTLLCNICNLLLATREPPDVDFYNSLIVRLTRLKRLANVQAVIDSMRECHIRPNAITLSAVLHYYTITQNKAEFIDLTRKMDGKFGGLWRAHPTMILYPGLQERYVLNKWRGKEIMVKDEDQDLLYEEQSHAHLGLLQETSSKEKASLQKVIGTARMGMKDRIVYSALIHGSLKLDQPSWAMRHYSDMVNEGFKPDRSVLKSILEYCTRNQDWDAGVAVWKQLWGIAEGFNQVVLGLMLTLCRSCGNFIEYGEVLNHGVRAGLIESGQARFPDALARGLKDQSLDANDLVAFPRLPHLQIIINRDYLERAVELLAYQIADTALEAASFDFFARKESVGFKAYVKIKRLYEDSPAAEAYRCRSIRSYGAVGEASFRANYDWKYAFQSLPQDEENNAMPVDGMRDISPSNQNTEADGASLEEYSIAELSPKDLGARGMTSKLLPAFHSACKHEEFHGSSVELNDDHEHLLGDQDTETYRDQGVHDPSHQNGEDAEAPSVERGARSNELEEAQDMPIRPHAVDEALPRSPGTQEALIQLITQLISSDESADQPSYAAESVQSTIKSQRMQTGVAASSIPQFLPSSQGHVPKLQEQYFQIPTNAGDPVEQTPQDHKTQVTQSQQLHQSPPAVVWRSWTSRQPTPPKVSPEALLEWDDAVESIEERVPHPEAQEMEDRLFHTFASSSTLIGVQAGRFDASRRVLVGERAQDPGNGETRIKTPENVLPPFEHQDRVDGGQVVMKRLERSYVDAPLEEETHKSVRMGVASRRVPLSSVRKPPVIRRLLEETSPQPATATAPADIPQFPIQNVQDHYVPEDHSQKWPIDERQNHCGGPSCVTKHRSTKSSGYRRLLLQSADSEIPPFPLDQTAKPLAPFEPLAIERVADLDRPEKEVLLNESAREPTSERPLLERDRARTMSTAERFLASCKLRDGVSHTESSTVKNSDNLSDKGLMTFSPELESSNETTPKNASRQLRSYKQKKAGNRDASQSIVSELGNAFARLDVGPTKEKSRSQRRLNCCSRVDLQDNKGLCQPFIGDIRMAANLSVNSPKRTATGPSSQLGTADGAVHSDLSNDEDPGCFSRSLREIRLVEYSNASVLVSLNDDRSNASDPSQAVYPLERGLRKEEVGNTELVQWWYAKLLRDGPVLFPPPDSSNRLPASASCDELKRTATGPGHQSGAKDDTLLEQESFKRSAPFKQLLLEEHREDLPQAGTSARPANRRRWRRRQRLHEQPLLDEKSPSQESARLDRARWMRVLRVYRNAVALERQAVSPFLLVTERLSM